MTDPSRLRILHILPSLGIGGAEMMATDLMTGLAATGHEVTAVGLYPERGSLVEERLQQGNVAVRYLGKRRGLDVRMLPAVSRTIREVQPDVVHTHLSVLRYVFPILLRQPVPVAIHTLHNAAAREADGFGRFVQRIAFKRHVIPVAVSRDGAKTYEEVYRRRCPAMIPNCIPVDRYDLPAGVGTAWRERNGFQPDDVIFACVGRLEEQKNPLGLIRAFADVAESRAHLILVGAGSYQDRVTAFIAEKNLQSRIHVMGVRNDIEDCLAASDVFVLASDWEGSPLAVMEAMASALPVVSTDVGGVPELVENGRDGILVAQGDMRSLGAAMQKLAGDADRRRELGASGRRRARSEFAVGAMTQRYAVLYQSLLETAQVPHAALPSDPKAASVKAWMDGDALRTRTAAENEGR
jgi:glycosyltransferase involved in cell wall biosynthesis